MSCAFVARVAGSVVLCVVLLAGGVATPAAAQGYAQPNGLGGFVHGLFGGSPPQIQQMPQAVPQSSAPYLPQATTPGRMPAQSKMPPRPAEPRKAAANPNSGNQSRNAAASLGGGLRTMCVRLCDGYYWPVTFNANRSRIGHDTKACSASCASEARLFTMPDSGEAKDMVDAQGRPYAKLANAFKYRKSSAGSCSCKPDPWEPEARARHELFAEKAEVDKRAALAAAEATPDDSVVVASAADVPKRLTLADAETLLLAGGIPSSSAAAEPASEVAVPVAQAGPAVEKVAAPQTTARLADATAPGTRESSSRTKSVQRRTVDGKAPSTRAKTQASRPIVAVAYRPSGQVFMTPQGYPAGLGRQPYVIGQPQFVPYRTY